MRKSNVKDYDPSQPLLSIHIPKCAGSSLKLTLSDWFPGKMYFHYFDEQAGRPPEKYKLGAGACVHGHFVRARGFGVEEYYPEIEQRMTILRHPLQVAISNYFFVKRQAKTGNLYRDGVKRKSVAPSLETFLNKHTSHICNFLPEAMDEDNYRDVLDEYFLFIGVVERMHETMTALSALLRKPNTDIPHVNESPRDDAFSKQTEVEFRERNLFAYKVFDYANERLNKIAAC